MGGFTAIEAATLRTALRRAGYPRAAENLPELTVGVPLPVHRRAHRVMWRFDRTSAGKPAAFIRDRIIAAGDSTEAPRDDKLDAYLSIRIPTTLHVRLRRAYGDEVSARLRDLIEADLDARGVR